MEAAIYIADISRRGDDYSRYGRLYVGSEFCAHLLPTPAQLAAFCADHSAWPITLMTPPVAEAEFSQAEQLLCLLPLAVDEVVVSDWGVLNYLICRPELGLALVLGRLFSKQQLGPAERESSYWPEEHSYRSATAYSPEFLGWCTKNGIARVEFSAVADFLVPDTGAIGISWVWGLQPVTVTALCSFRFQAEAGWGSSACPGYCRSQRVELSADRFAEPLTLVHNAVFAQGTAQNNLPRGQMINRTVAYEL